MFFSFFQITVRKKKKEKQINTAEGKRERLNNTI